MSSSTKSSNGRKMGKKTDLLRSKMFLSFFFICGGGFSYSWTHTHTHTFLWWFVVCCCWMEEVFRAATGAEAPRSRFAIPARKYRVSPKVLLAQLQVQVPLLVEQEEVLVTKIAPKSKIDHPVGRARVVLGTYASMLYSMYRTVNSRYRVVKKTLHVSLNHSTAHYYCTYVAKHESQRNLGKV